MQKFFRSSISSVTPDLNRRILLDYMVGRQFMLHHDLIGQSTSIITADGGLNQMNKSAIGINIEGADLTLDLGHDFIYVPIATFQQKTQGPITYPIDTIYSIFRDLKLNLFTSFCASSIGEVSKLKHDIEDRISKIDVRQSHTTSSRQTMENDSASSDLYYQSYEKKLLGMFLENINEILISRYSSYKVAFLVEKSAMSDDIISCLKSTSIVLDIKHVKVKNIDDLYSKAGNLPSFPLSYSNAAQGICLSNRIAKAVKINTRSRPPNGDILIGNHIESGINETEEKVRMSSSVLNLGILIAGLPGTGKTRAAQNIISQSIRLNSKAVIISPTSEWNRFGEINGLNVITAGKSNLNINFFKCETSNPRRFYENLAMLLAEGCNCGPYKNSLEKCLLSAFSKVYANTKNPDPQSVYEEIEESIIEQHGKRTSTSVKYTKHGENTKAALESLRQLLMIPQFAYAESTCFMKLFEGGIVFDLSFMSNNSKPLLYALFLNQVYNICDELDLNGDDKLRVLLCLEEAQMVFNPDDESGATHDLKQRIQNFRKNGVGIMLIAHNINDISPNIRRLCQNKLYFRQSADIAKYAANDLVFDEPDYEKVVTILKTLGQRECAVNAITIQDGQKAVSNSIFSKIHEYGGSEAFTERENAQYEHKATTIRMNMDMENAGARYEIYYLGERITSGISYSKEINVANLLEGKSYRLVILGKKRRDDTEFRIIGGTQNVLPKPAQ